MGFNRTHVISSQNHYDASRPKFNPNYYGYLTHRITSELTLLSGRAPWTFQIHGSAGKQSYADRLVQDSTGAYGTDTTHVDFAFVDFSVAYPIARGFSVKALTAFGWNDSNNTYTQVYQYHYNTQMYLFGFTYAY